MWPLALLYWVSLRRGGAALDAGRLGVVGAELVAFLWACELAQNIPSGPGRSAGWPLPDWCCSSINPWSWWSMSFDFHAECLAVLFMALLAWDLANGRRRAWLWIALLVACGDVAGTYISDWGSGLGDCGTRAADAVARSWPDLGSSRCWGSPRSMATWDPGHGLQSYDYLAAPAAIRASLTLTRARSTAWLRILAAVLAEDVVQTSGHLGEPRRLSGPAGCGVPAAAAHLAGRHGVQRPVQRLAVLRAAVPVRCLSTCCCRRAPSRSWRGWHAGGAGRPWSSRY